jgi:hypothetical protein
LTALLNTGDFTPSMEQTAGLMYALARKLANTHRRLPWFS